MPKTVTLPLEDEVNDTVNRLIKQLDDHRKKNLLLDAYYDAERNLRRVHNGVIPLQYYNLGLALGWSSKAVDALARRCGLDQMVWPEGDLDAIGYPELARDNQLVSECNQGVTSALVHGLAFVVASPGVEPTDPPGMVHFYSATESTGTRNPRSRRLTELLVVNDRDKRRNPTALTLYLPGQIITAELDAGDWSVDILEHKFDVPAAPMVYRPRLDRPMGRTRLTRPVRGIQDAALRALVRLEGHMDVYAYPEFWMLGADESVFKDDTGRPLAKWQVMLGRIKGIPDAEDVDDPALARADVKKFEAASPDPHLAALNAYSKLFARETSLPDSAVAITDFANPTSADSYNASQWELIGEAEGTTGELSTALAQVVPIALAMANGYTEVPADWASIQPQWRDPRFLSRAAEADAGTKVMAAVPWLADTEVGLKMIGLSTQDVELAMSERLRAESRTRLDQLAGLAVQSPQTAETAETAETGPTGPAAA